jgi:Fuc2NAc and GlcNAc transferase
MRSTGSLVQIGLLAAACLTTIAGTLVYRSFAIRRGIVAVPNFRSLHQRPLPRGGGIVFSLVCIAAVIGLSFTGTVDPRLMRALVAGGAVATVFGFVDDAMHVGPAVKLLVQMALAGWVLVCFDGKPLVDLPLTPKWLDVAVSWIGLVWLMNLYNFIDGIDGLAAMGAVSMSVISILVLLLSGADRSFVLILAALALCSFGFLIFNWPPASIFMGDSGSQFLGFYFGTLIAATMIHGDLGFWSWLVIFGYFAGDTTTTTLVRVFVTDKWYGEHRSHAYQNLARIWGSHLKVVKGVSLYHLLWLLPLAIWSVLTPPAAPVAAILAVAPVVLWTLRYGPRLSSS